MAHEPLGAPRLPERINRVAICIATRGRPILLGKLLGSIANLAFRGSAPQLSIVVCDNDSIQSARPTELPPESLRPRDIVYLHEPTPGIPYARNKAVHSALDLGADAIVFVDDDETVDPNWLEALLAAQAKHNAHVVTGPVHAEIESTAPAWIVRGGFFDRPVYPTGHVLPFAATNNTLVVRSVFEAVGWFDTRLALTGGSDTHFFIRARLAGARIIAAEDAHVNEFIPRTRAKIGWILRRAFRGQAVYVKFEREFSSFLEWFPRRLIRTVALATRGSLKVLLGIATGRTMLLRGLHDLARAAGAIAGAADFLIEEYRIVHGN